MMAGQSKGIDRRNPDRGTGRPCRRCGGTERYRDGKCAPCRRLREMGYARKRVESREPCGKCGSTDRYRSGRCAPCHRAAVAACRATHREQTAARLEERRDRDAPRARRAARRTAQRARKAESHGQEAGTRSTAAQAAHRAARLARKAAYYAAHREERRAYDAAYRAGHREQQRAYSAAYRAACRDGARVAGPCRRCGGTERYRDGRCASCARARKAAYPDTYVQSVIASIPPGAVPCRTVRDDLWFTQSRTAQTLAKQLCRDHCPMRAECEAIGWDQPHGVFGGLSAADRRRIDRSRAQRAFRAAARLSNELDRAARRARKAA